MTEPFRSESAATESKPNSPAESWESPGLLGEGLSGSSGSLELHCSRRWSLIWGKSSPAFSPAGVLAGASLRPVIKEGQEGEGQRRDGPEWPWALAVGRGLVASGGGALPRMHTGPSNRGGRRVPQASAV